MTAQPSLYETVVLKGTYEDLPHPEVPYFVITQETTFLHKDTAIGKALIKQIGMPKQMVQNLPAIGFKGIFTWRGERIPAAIISQAHDFFRRIYEKYHSEAEVLITKNDAGDYRLFVPLQRASHGGVKSIYEPTHIEQGWLNVGTIHSHCDFSPFHSGTDSDDASKKDGVHFTIGYVNQSPKIVAMVVMNGEEFPYNNPEDIAEIEWGTASAPEWWDNFVFAGDRKAPETKPPSLISLSQSDWEEFLGRALFKPKPFVQNGTTWRTPSTWTPIPARVYDDWANTKDWKDWGKPKKRTPGEIEDAAIEDMLDFAMEKGVISDDDWDDTKPSDIGQIEYWQGFLTARLQNTIEALELLGINITIKAKKGRIK